MADFQSSFVYSEEIALLIFYLGETVCGIDVRMVQEVNKQLDVTFVPLAPEFVRGVLNLRGQIVTAIDLGQKLGLEALGEKERQRNIIVRFENEYFGLLVDRVGDVFEIDPKMVEAPPANIGNVFGKYFNGILKNENSLVGILNVGEVLKF